MSAPRLPSASRQTALGLLGLLLVLGSAWARDFNTENLSDPKGNARLPSIGETGLAAWQGYSANEGGAPLATRTDIAASPADSQRSDIYIWNNGQARNITGEDVRIAGRSERPLVFRDSVVFTARFRDDIGGGYPFELSIPPKTDQMLQMQQDYPDLFDPPVSAREAADTLTNAPAETVTTNEAAVTNAPPDVNAPQRQRGWRGSGKEGDIAVYRLDNGLERITPGTRHFSIPVMSDAGIAFQCARGWPYGYEMLVWTPGATNLVQITTNYFYVLNPDLHGNELVFQVWDGNDYEIYRYAFDTGLLEQITNNQFDDISPVVWNGEIAWVAHPAITPEIFHMTVDGIIRKISEDTQDNAAPCIWEGKVVWQGYDDTDLEIYYFNGRRTIKLTSNTWDDMAPRARDGLITWMSYVDNWDAEIMALDLSDNVAVQLTDNDTEDSFPQTAGEKIVWQALGFEGSYIQMATPASPRTGSVD